MIDLFQRNFDQQSGSPAFTSGERARLAEQAEIAERVETARKEGFDAGRTIGRQDAQAEIDAEREARLTAERTAIRDQLNALLEQDAQQRRDTERDIVELFLGIAERLVPELLDSYGRDLALDRIRQSVEQSRTDPVLTVRAAPDVAEALQADPPEWMAGAMRSAQIDVVPDPEMAQSAAQVRWRSGRMEYDLQAATNAVLTALKTAAEDYHEAPEKAG